MATAPLDDLPAALDGRRVLCRDDGVGEAGRSVSVAGLDRTTPEKLLDLFLIRDGETLRCYVDMCPHLGSSLHFLPDTYLDSTRSYILCATHGARFSKADGRCFAGPCLDEKLVGVPIHVREDGVVLLGPPPAAGGGG